MAIDTQHLTSLVVAAVAEQAAGIPSGPALDAMRAALGLDSHLRLYCLDQAIKLVMGERRRNERPLLRSPLSQWLRSLPRDGFALVAQSAAQAVYRS